MKSITVLLFCVVFVCAKNDCDNSKCADEIIKEIIHDNTPLENLDIKLELPELNITNVAVEDLNKVLLNLANWFENKVNETNFLYNRVNNKTKIFVKTFDFNVDFENGNANFDVGLADGNDFYKHDFDFLYNESDSLHESRVIPDTIKEIDSLASTISKAIEKNRNKLISRHDSNLANEIFETIDFDTTYYDTNEDNSTDYPIIDYIELYKDTTNEERLFTEADLPSTLPDFDDNSTERTVTSNRDFKDSFSEPTCHGNHTCEEFTKTVFPWVVTIFIKSSDNNQFQYVCDGALLSEKVILTDARCMLASNKTVDSQNVLVFLGKENLNVMSDSERLHQIKEIILHQNLSVYDNGTAVNDLALLTLETAAVLDQKVQSACIHSNDMGDLEMAGTTSWDSNGDLLPIFFEKDRSDICYDKDENIFCATYGLNVALCPSYGGLYATRRSSHWCLEGIYYGDPLTRGFCFNKNVWYTSLGNYFNWIDDIVDINKNIL